MEAEGRKCDKERERKIAFKGMEGVNKNGRKKGRKEG